MVVICVFVILDGQVMVLFVTVSITDCVCLIFCWYSIFTILLDIDECGIHSDNCDINADCTNTNGSFICSCRSGWHGDGVHCEGKTS